MQNSLILSVLTLAASAATLKYEVPTDDLPRKHTSRYANLWDDMVIDGERDRADRQVYDRRQQELQEQAPSHSAALNPD